MKKLALTMALVLVMGLGAIAQQGDGLLKRGGDRKGGGSKSRDDIGLTIPIIPNYGSTEDSNGTPLGSGVALLLAMGGAYFVAKKRKEE